MSSPFKLFITIMVALIVSLCIVNIAIANERPKRVPTVIECIGFNNVIVKYRPLSFSRNEYHGTISIYIPGQSITYPSHMCIVYENQ